MSRPESTFKSSLIAKSAVRLFDQDQSEEQVEWFLRKGRSDEEFVQGVSQTCRALSSAQALEQDPEFMDWVGETLGESLLVEEPARRPGTGRLVAGIILMIGVSVVTWLGLDGPSGDSVQERYVSRVGEVKTVHLSDQTAVTLNTGSQIFIDIGSNHRRVVFDRGEAFFDVAKDESRPFSIDLGGQTVTVLGTQFSIRKEPTRMVLAVSSGLVLLHSSRENAIKTAPLIEEGDSSQVFVRGELVQRRIGRNWVVEYDESSSTLSAYKSANIDRVMSWRNGVLHFRKTPLKEVIYELNRYSGKKIMIEDTSLMEVPITASLRVDQINSALAGLQASHHITVVNHFDHIVISSSQEEK